MKIPAGKTEDEVLEAIERAASILAPTFPFGYYDIDDIKQEARLESLLLIEGGQYDPSKPLDNFIYSNMRNRLINLQRNKLKRSDSPCKPCHRGEPCCEGGCDKYAVWKKRNASKANLARPIAICEDRCESGLSRGLSEAVDTESLLTRIDENLSTELRLFWKQILDDVKLPKAKRDLVEAAVRKILGVDSPYLESDDSA